MKRRRRAECAVTLRHPGRGDEGAEEGVLQDHLPPGQDTRELEGIVDIGNHGASLGCKQAEPALALVSR